MLPEAAHSLRAELLEAFARGFDTPISADTFENLALRAFRTQFELNPPYRAYCERRGRTPDNVAHTGEVPAVPTAAFKEVALCIGDPATAEAVFRTSGTTRGVE